MNFLPYSLTQTGFFDTELDNEIILSAGIEGEYIIQNISIQGWSKTDPETAWMFTCLGDNQIVLASFGHDILPSANYFQSRDIDLYYPCTTSDEYASLISLTASGSQIKGHWSVTYAPVPTTTIMNIANPTQDIATGLFLFFVVFFGLIFYFRSKEK